MTDLDDRLEHLLGVYRGALGNALDVRGRGLEGANFGEFAGEGGLGFCEILLLAMTIPSEGRSMPDP